MVTSAVEVLWTARYDYQRDWKLLVHHHEHFQLLYLLGGSGKLTLAEREYEIEPGCLFLIKPRTPHALNPSSLVKTLDVKFMVNDRSLLQALMQAGDEAKEREPLAASLLEHIRREGETAALLYRDMCNLYLSQVLIHFLRLQAANTPEKAEDELTDDWSPDSVTQCTVDFIKEHYAEELDVRRIARAVGKSDRYVRRHFDEFLGTSPMRYLLHYRIRKAKELIRDADYELKEVAERVGFKTIHHFARAFREICGETPGAWRRKYRAGICKDVCIHPEFLNTIWTVTNAQVS